MRGNKSFLTPISPNPKLRYPPSILLIFFSNNVVKYETTLKPNEQNLDHSISFYFVFNLGNCVMSKKKTNCVVVLLVI